MYNIRTDKCDIVVTADSKLKQNTSKNKQMNYYRILSKFYLPMRMYEKS